jgi:uncharacterized protein (DUF302 family)
MAVEGLITARSPGEPVETVARLRAEIAAHGLTIFAEINHAAGAEAAGLTLRPLFLIIFGAVKGGTPLMQTVATAGIDLPLKILVWRDAAGETQVSYNDPYWVAKRHELGENVAALVEAMSTLLRELVDAAIA